MIQPDGGIGLVESCAIISPAQLKSLYPVQQAPKIDTPEDSPLMRLLISANQEQLSNAFTERQCEPGEIVFQEGEPADAMFLIGSGQVVVFRGSLDQPVILAYRCAGEIIGEMALLDDRPRSATVIALEPLRLLSIDRRCFEQLLVEVPSVGRHIMGILSSRLRRLSEGHGHAEQSEKSPTRQVSVAQEKQTQTLRIELNGALQQKQVSEITESEYFILLQSKAKDLRDMINGADE